MKEYNEDLKVERLGNQLDGKSIALCITGGIAAIETPKIARHFRRFGAEVRAYLTPAALDFIGEASLVWATGKPAVKELTGNAEHICLEDVVVVAPATLNTINKIYAGIADNPVTTLIASALGQNKPIYVAPTMHESLYKNPFFQQSLRKLPEYGVRILEPRLGESKAKMPRTSYIVNTVINDWGKK
jgi:phosphopantothenoylcysteine decarboxylase/phosphopantothenate--cysteine ligase